MGTGGMVARHPGMIQLMTLGGGVLRRPNQFVVVDISRNIIHPLF
jgi:hypothetical protein